MATQVQFRRGTTSQNNAFTGAQGELTIDTQVYTIRIHDGTTAGGKTVPTLTATQTMTNKTMGSSSVWNGNVIGLTYGGTGAALTAAAGAVVYSTSSGLGLSLAGTSGQVLTSGGVSGPTWVNASSLSTGTATTATLATNIAGGSAGYLMYQTDTNTTGFIAPGTSGYILRSAGASTAPTWVTSALTIGSTAAQVGDTTTSFAGVTSFTMGNGSYGGGTVGTITGSGPWTATITGMSSTTGIMVGQNITATAGTGSFYGGSPTSVVVASIVSGTSITITVTGGTTPTAGTVTSITTLGFLQVPTGTTAQRPWVPANGMIRYNSTQSSFEGYASSAWSSLGGVKSVDGYTYIQAETSAGASNGDLDFYAENSGGNGATQVGQWNRTNLKDYTGTLVGTQTTQNVFNTTATTVNAFGASTTTTVGATTGTHTINNPTVVGSQTTVNLWNTTSTTVNAFGASTATTVGATTGTHTIRNATVSFPNATAITTGQTTVALLNTTATTVNAFGAATALALGSSSSATLTVNPGTVVGANTTQNLFNTTATTLNIGGAATTISLGAATGTTTINNANVVITGNLTVNGSTTTSSSQNTGYGDSLVDLHYTNGGVNTSDDGKDIGLVFNYYKTTDKNAYLIWSNATQAMEYYSTATDNGTVISGTLGNYKGAGFIYSGSSSGTTTVVATATAGTTTLTLPAATDTLVGKATTDTLTNKTIAAGSNTISGLTNSNLSGTAGITNANLANSTISGISLGSNLAALTIGTGLTGTSYNGSTGVTIALGTSGVSAATYGSSTQIPVFAVDTYGRVTSVTNTTVQGGQYYGAAATKAIAYNSDSIAENITISAGNNGLSAGPVTIANGYTVTVATGAVWTIV